MRIAFAGTPDFAATVLEGLISSKHEVGLVISQPDARRGRGRKTIPTPVAQLATEHELPLIQPELISEAAEQIATHDALVVAAYGQILRPDTLYAAKFGAWNVHGSLLPKHRGAAPVERAIMAGETTTGVTIIEMDEGLDTGKIAKKCKVPVDPTANGGELRQQLAEIGAKAMVEVLGLLWTSELTLKDQDDSEATYATKISSSERVVKWRKSRVEVLNLVRALSPHIGARTFHPGVNGSVGILDAHIPEVTVPVLLPGDILAEDGKILVGCLDGSLSVERIQLPGGRPMSAEEFLRGNQLDGAFII